MRARFYERLPYFLHMWYRVMRVDVLLMYFLKNSAFVFAKTSIGEANTL